MERDKRSFCSFCFQVFNWVEEKIIETVAGEDEFLHLQCFAKKHGIRLGALKKMKRPAVDIGVHNCFRITICSSLCSV